MTEEPFDIAPLILIGFLILLLWFINSGYPSKIVEVFYDRGDKKKRKQNALFDGVRALLKSQIYEVYKKGLKCGSITPTEFDIAASCYINYVELGGNHTMPAIYEKICNMSVVDLDNAQVEKR